MLGGVLQLIAGLDIVELKWDNICKIKLYSDLTYYYFLLMFLEGMIFIFLLLSLYNILILSEEGYNILI